MGTKSRLWKRPLDERLVERVRGRLAGIAGADEKKMFGGICWTVNGHMAAGVLADALIVRVAADPWQAALAEPGAGPMEMMGRRPPAGFVVVAGASVAAPSPLQHWLDRGVAYAGSLPPK